MYKNIFVTHLWSLLKNVSMYLRQMCILLLFGEVFFRPIGFLGWFTTSISLLFLCVDVLSTI